MDVVATYRCPNPKCRRLEWTGHGRMIVDEHGVAVCVDFEGTDEPEWTCICGHVTKRPSPLANRLDALCSGFNPIW